MEGARVRHIMSGIYYLGVSWLLGGLNLSLCALSWIVTSTLSNFCGWSDHFVTKNYYSMSAGAIAMLVGARLLGGEMTNSIVPPILAATWIGLSMDGQDFRDVKGDLASGRTLQRPFGVWKLLASSGV